MLRDTRASVRDGFFATVVSGFLGIMAVALYAAFMP